jgi:hypothetical protein
MLMLPCIVTEITTWTVIATVLFYIFSMVVSIWTVLRILRKDHQKELDKKADIDYVNRIEKDLKEEIQTQKETIDCQEQTRIRENNEHKEYYQKALDEVNGKLDMILQAIIDGKIKINGKK